MEKKDLKTINRYDDKKRYEDNRDTIIQIVTTDKILCSKDKGYG